MRAILLMVLLAACSPGTTATERTVTGTMTLEGQASYAVETDSQVCFGEGGYNDLVAGAPVTVTDQDGTIIGTSALGSGVLPPGAATSCVFEFTLSALPEATFYSFEVSHRGEVRYSAADLEAAGWSVSLSIGG